MTVTWEITEREATILAELRAMARLQSDPDVIRLALFRMAREFGIENLHHSDYALGSNRSRSFHVEHTDQVREGRYVQESQE